MEPLDREIAKALADQPLPQGPARVLLVGTSYHRETGLLAGLDERKHHCTRVERLGEARAAITRTRFDVILLNPKLPDGAGLTLLPLVHKTAPSTQTIVVAEEPPIDLIVEAMRGGVMDVFDVAVTSAEVALDRLDAAIIRSRVEQQREDRIVRLKKICRELNLARREVTEQVDGLCNDLATAYQDIGSQLNHVAMATEFRTLVQQELDVEDLLRTTLEYMLTKTGATNAAVFLADHDKNFGLGAYVNYDCPRDTIAVLLDNLCQAICPQIMDEPDIVAYDDADEFAKSMGIDAEFLGDSQVVAWSCRHRDECLAVVILFRSRSDPFGEELAATIDVLRPIFARQLANVVTIHHRANTAWPPDAAPEDNYDCGDDYGFGWGDGAAAA